jgi:hypothetical protein
MRFRASRVAAVAVLVSASARVTSAQAESGESACAALRPLHVPGVVLSDMTAQWLPPDRRRRRSRLGFGHWRCRCRPTAV